MTEDQLRILRDIHTRGRTVLYRFGGEYPEWGDTEDDYPRSDWNILRTQLGEMKHTKGGYIRTNERHIITRRFVKYGRIWIGQYEVYPDGTEVQGDIKAEEWDFMNGPDQVISETHEIIADMKPYRGSSYWTSEYIEVEKLDMGDWFEEFCGLKYRYTLTEKALEAIGDQSK